MSFIPHWGVAVEVAEPNVFRGGGIGISLFYCGGGKVAIEGVHIARVGLVVIYVKDSYGAPFTSNLDSGYVWAVDGDGGPAVGR